MDALKSQTGEDWRLFRAAGDAAAFGRLIRALADLVHSAALRVTQDRAMAEDVTQAVFLLLARKGRSLPVEVQPGPWCWRQAVRLALNAVRTESRRRNREHIYAAMNEPAETQDAWRAMAPVLDEALASLPPSDQEVIIGKYFERQDMATLARRMGISAEAAQKRSSRALERLRSLLRRRGVSTTAAMLGLALKSESVSAAPLPLAAKCAKAAAPAIPAGSLPVVISVLGTRTAAAGLAAGLVLAGWWGWQWAADASGSDLQSATLAAGTSTAAPPATPEGAEAADEEKKTRLSFSEVIRQLADSHWQPANLATKKRIQWLFAQIAPERLPDTARWVLERRHFREREPLLGSLWATWMERDPERCADFWTDEIYALSAEDGWSNPWWGLCSSLRGAVARNLPPGRLDEWFLRRIAAEPALLHTRSWAALAGPLVRERLREDPQAAVSLMTRLPSGPGRRGFLEGALSGYGYTGADQTFTTAAALAAFHAIPDETLRREAVGTVLETRASTYDRTVLDWWLQLPENDRLLYARDVLSHRHLQLSGGTDSQFNQAGAEEILGHIPPEKQAQIAVSRSHFPYTGTRGMEAYTDAAGAIPELTQFHAVMRAKDQPSRLAAAAAVEHPALQARLLRGLYGNWHEQDAAAAETWLQQSGWPAETQAALREASAPLSQ